MKFNLNLDNVNYIKIVYKDRNNSTCCTKAAIKFMGDREITACAKFENGLRIETPQEIMLSFVCGNGLYRTQTVLKYISYEDPYVFFILQTPEGLEYQQNREYFRVCMTENVLLSFEGRTIPCKTYDISATGVCLTLPSKIEIPENVTIEVLFSNKSIKAKAKFLRFSNEDEQLKASFKFVDLPENEVDIISQKCIQRQLENKRSSLK